MLNNVIRVVYEESADHDKYILRQTLLTPSFREFLLQCIARTNEDMQQLDYKDAIQLQKDFIALTERKAAASDFLNLLTLLESELKALENSNEVS